MEIPPVYYKSLIWREDAEDIYTVGEKQCEDEDRKSTKGMKTEADKGECQEDRGREESAENIKREKKMKENSKVFEIKTEMELKDRLKEER